MFAGTGGSGVEDMPSSHSEIMPKQCVTCHMYKEEEDKIREKGGHTFRVNEKVCLKCHDDPESLVSKRQSEITTLLKQLKSLLDRASDKRSKSYMIAKLNYDIVIADNGLGIHNPKYAKALLKYSIASLTAHSAWKP
jgi:formate-dependent nitrite reductase cytochrome c552 subunit